MHCYETHQRCAPQAQPMVGQLRRRPKARVCLGASQEGLVGSGGARHGAKAPSEPSQTALAWCMDGPQPWSTVL